MKKLFYRCCNAFLALAFVVGNVDVSLMSRQQYYQPPVPDKLLKHQ